MNREIQDGLVGIPWPSVATEVQESAAVACWEHGCVSRCCNHQVVGGYCSCKRLSLGALWGLKNKKLKMCLSGLLTCQPYSVDTCVCVAFQKELSESLIVVGIWVCCLSTWQVIWLRICLAVFGTLRVKICPLFLYWFSWSINSICVRENPCLTCVCERACVSRQPSTPSAKCKLMMLFPFSNHFSVSVRRIMKPHKR